MGVQKQNPLAGFLTGSNAVVGRLQAPLRQFLRSRLEVTNHDDIPSSVRRVLDDTHSSMASAVSAANVAEAGFIFEHLARNPRFVNVTRRPGCSPGPS